MCLIRDFYPEHINSSCKRGMPLFLETGKFESGRHFVKRSNFPQLATLHPPCIDGAIETHRGTTGIPADSFPQCTLLQVLTMVASVPTKLRQPRLDRITRATFAPLSVPLRLASLHLPPTPRSYSNPPSRIRGACLHRRARETELRRVLGAGLRQGALALQRCRRGLPGGPWAAGPAWREPITCQKPHQRSVCAGALGIPSSLAHGGAELREAVPAPQRSVGRAFWRRPLSGRVWGPCRPRATVRTARTARTARRSWTTAPVVRRVVLARPVAPEIPEAGTAPRRRAPWLGKLPRSRGHRPPQGMGHPDHRGAAVRPPGKPQKSKCWNCILSTELPRSGGQWGIAGRGGRWGPRWMGGRGFGDLRGHRREVVGGG